MGINLGVGNVSRNSSLRLIGLVAAFSILLSACGGEENVVTGGAGAVPSEAPAATTTAADGTTPKANDRVMGSPDAPVTIIEFASMTCPHCAAFNVITFPQIKEEYIDTGKVKFIFREFPLDGVASIASALARCQTGDNYFSFIDLIFHNQQEWITAVQGGEQTQEGVQESLVPYARIAGLGREQAIACMQDPQNQAAVEENWSEAQNQYNISSTPGFVINGTTYSGAMPIEQFREIIDPLL
jgi:protein-disulfide isomerase